MRKSTYLLVAAMSSVPVALPDRALGSQFTYHSPGQIRETVKDIDVQYGQLSVLHLLARSPGDRDVLLLELGERRSDAPAILVAANMEGDCPIATEAALQLARLLVTDWRAELERHTWYILPVGNPDGHARFFRRPLDSGFTNDRPLNDDNDDATDEDGPEDLNADGYITMMRQAHPEGTWAKVDGNPVLMKKADSAKGVKGEFRLFTEGIDNDGDGKINEDGPGGAIPGHNFPHNFQHYTTTDGRWAASEPETRGLLRFAFDHPEIAMVVTFGRSNSLKEIPPSSRKTEAAQDKYKLPENFAKRMGVDPKTEFPLKELVEMGREYTGYTELTEEMVLQFLGVGAAANPDKADLPYWTELSKRYNEFIKKAGLDAERLKPPAFSPGCIEEWAYYQYGVPSFSMDFWTLPAKKKDKKEGDGALSADEIEKMSNEDFVGMGEEKIAALLKATGAPAHFTPQMVISAVQSGMMDTKKVAEFMRDAEKKKEAGGIDETDDALYAFNQDAFATWEPYNHPTLGAVEIGGRLPYATLAPPAARVSELLDAQLPFVRELAALLPRVVIKKVEPTREAPDVWKLSAWIVNEGFLPFPTHQGKRCKRPTPVVVTLVGESVTLLEGRDRAVLKLLEGSGGTAKVTWLLQAKEGTPITLHVHSFSAGSDSATLTLTGGTE